MDNRKHNIIRKTYPFIKKATVVILFSGLLLYFARISLWDYDYWWHIATGQYIVTEGRLPDADPFSYTSAMEENKNIFPEWERFIIKQYWLAQVIMFEIFQNTGQTGIVLFRSFLLLLTLLTVYLRLKNSGTSFHISFIFIFILFTISTRSTGERPVLFSFLFTAVMLLILEEYRRGKGYKIFLAVPLMLLWSNLHGGFIIGNLIIVTYMVGEFLKIVFKKSPLIGREKAIFFGASSLALLSSFINPMGWSSFFIAFSPKYNIFIRDIQEWTSPWTMYRNKLRPFDYSFAFLAIIFPLTLFVRNKRFDLNHFLLLSGFLYMSLNSARFVFFYAIIASMILAKESDTVLKSLIHRAWKEDKYNKFEYVLAVFALCSILIFMFGHFKYDKFRFGMINKQTVPEAAVNFIKKNKLDGNMFNDYGYGGYITWRLYPEQKNFIDTRSLNYTVMTEYGWIWNAQMSSDEVNPSDSNTPLWKRLLKHYKINFVFISAFDLYGMVSPLALALIADKDWEPVYFDPISIIFVKNDSKNRDIIQNFRIENDHIYNSIIYLSATSSNTDNINPRYFISLGETFYAMGNLDDAVKAYRHALKRMPNSSIIKERLDQFEDEQRIINDNGHNAKQQLD